MIPLAWDPQLCESRGIDPSKQVNMHASACSVLGDLSVFCSWFDSGVLAPSFDLPFWDCYLLLHLSYFLSSYLFIYFLIIATEMKLGQWFRLLL